MAPPTRSTGTTNSQPSSQDQLQQLEEQLAQLLNTQTTLQEENQHLQAQVATLTALPPVHETESPHTTPSDHRPERELSHALTGITASTNSRPTEPKVAAPEYYSGQRNKLTTFITQVTMVLVLQASRYPTEKSKIFYAGSFLRDTAFLWFQPYVTAHPQPEFMLSFEKFCIELRNTFGDPDEVATAERQLYALHQRGSTSSYLAEFMRHAVLVKWNDEAKAAQFYRGLKDAIKDELARTGKPDSFKELQQAAIRIDSRLFERQVEKGERPFTTNTSQVRFTPRSSTTFTRTQTQSTYSKPAETLRATELHAEQLTRRGRLTPMEYQRRRENNLCLYCGDKGHQVLKCPVAPPARKFTSNTRVTTGITKPTSGKPSPQVGKA